ncbi:hypothetical protein JRO89_XS10G0056000 [Xanthoceras sorbifolium]|uniref:Uncharacterized protein n=1 Tax=Xanthoceras sorbifolium TaxID=99658 RepID=A0ABQ8HHR5_9ROSI|nr:hypothetical protein JRO89_XS10G0056000 [Xanthoceras sorbifolium]
MKLQKVSEPGTQEPVVVKQIDQMNIRGQNAGSPQFSFSLAEPLAKTHSNWVSTSRNLTILVVKLNSGDDGEVSFAVLKRKLGFCSSKLIAWSQGKFGSLRKQIAAKQEFISSLLGGNLDEDEQRQVKDLECFDILCWFHRFVSRRDFKFVCILLWLLWFDRNCSVRGGNLKDVAGLLENAASLLSDFQNTLKSILVQQPVPDLQPCYAEHPTEYALWNQCNSMIISWLTHSVEPDLAKGVIHAKTARQVWEDFKDQFSQKNSLWDELGTYRPIFACNQMKAYIEQREEDRMKQFLMGLNDT